MSMPPEPPDEIDEMLADGEQKLKEAGHRVLIFSQVRKRMQLEQCLKEQCCVYGERSYVR